MNDFDDWDRLVHFAMFSYNTPVHEATNFTPYELVFGKLAHCPISIPSDENLVTYNSYLHDLITRLSEMQVIAGQNLVQAKERSKLYYDRNARPFKGKIGDMVRVLVELKRGKFARRYHRPYKIIGILEGSNVLLRDENGKMLTKHVDKLQLN